jgi:hypothetical protein
VRGQAYLSAHQGAEASSEFQTIVEHRGMWLAIQLEFWRACNWPMFCPETQQRQIRLSGFPHTVKDADSEIPILRQAKTEYAQLKLQPECWRFRCRLISDNEQWK